ncbi:putative transcriptional regulator, MerR family [[Clostridium] ultunense Esp]|nr:putative transcriptional regulator, MerR family [[Clostridium] ultunense Esp]
MKIGEFANSNNLTIDTIRHYMDLGLIIPEKQGGQYYFDSRCQSDLENILNLKDMKFTLNEIKTIFLFRRLGKLTPYQEYEYYKAFYKNKYDSICQEVESLRDAKNKLQMKMKELVVKENKQKIKMGIDIRRLNLFKCVKCNGNLNLSQGNILDNQIIEGVLKCSCGVEYKIHDGILLVDNKKEQDGLTFDYDYIEDYINLTNVEYLENIYTSLEWMYKKIDFTSFNEKIIMELGSGAGFFLRHIYNDLPRDCVYLAIDYDYNRHIFLKNMLESIGIRKNIIFICCDFLDIPIEDNSIDILVDYSGTSNYSFEHKEFLLDLVNNYIKNRAYLIGAYILFKNFHFNSKIDSPFRRNFILDNINDKIINLGYIPIYEKVSEPIAKGGKYEDYFVKGEEVYFYLFYGKR